MPSTSYSTNCTVQYESTVKTQEAGQGGQGAVPFFDAIAET